MLLAALAACGGSEGVAPTALVDREPPEDFEHEDDAFLSRLVEHAAIQLCAVPGLVATRKQTYDLEMEEFIRSLDQVARALCEQGGRGIESGWGADGRPELLPDGGVLVERSVVVIGRGWEGEPVLFHGSVERTNVACGGRVGQEPDLVLFLGDGVSSRVDLVDQSEGTYLWVRGPDGSDRCSNVDPSGPHAVTVGAGDGPHRVWVGAADVEAADWTLQVSRSIQENRSWRPGFGAGERVHVSVDGFMLPAPTDVYYQYCTGFIGSQPTVVLEVEEAGYGLMTVEADGDSVLYLEGPDGSVLCNDDWQGNHAGVSAYFAAGTWSVYVGSYSSGARFTGTLQLD